MKRNKNKNFHLNSNNICYVVLLKSLKSWKQDFNFFSHNILHLDINSLIDPSIERKQEINSNEV